jgi:hypothetical protein
LDDKIAKKSNIFNDIWRRERNWGRTFSTWAHRGGK